MGADLQRRTATAFAPATVGNAAVGFDVLGFALPVVGDRVAVTRHDDLKGRIEVESVEDGGAGIPLDPTRNTAGVALASLVEGRGLPFGFSVRIEKGIPLAAGMGGSAASAVGAVVAANALLDEPLDLSEQCAHAVAGEACASGAPHADNVAPCLYGGLTLVLSHDPLDVLQIPVPQEIVCVLVHPHMHIETRDARGVLRPELALSTHTRQSALMGAFIAGCFRSDLELIGRSLDDLVVEPQRSRLIPGFDAVKRAALTAGALGASISGAGPSVFAWCRSHDSAARVRDGIRAAFDAAGLSVDDWLAPVGTGGAHVIDGDS